VSMPCLGIAPVAVIARNIWGTLYSLRPMASAVARVYNGALRAEPPAGFKSRAPGHGIRGTKPPEAEAEALLVFGRSMKAANLAVFLKFGKATKSNICVIFAKKIMDGHKTGGLDQNWGLCPPSAWA